MKLQSNYLTEASHLTFSKLKYNTRTTHSCFNITHEFNKTTQERPNLSNQATGLKQNNLKYMYHHNNVSAFDDAASAYKVGKSDKSMNIIGN